jgi:dTDP-4-dehydrorhamnose reductase
VAGVLVVGASGFLGGAVATELREAGHRVVGTYCSTPTPAADVQFDFWTDDVGALADEREVDAVVFAAAVEYGDEADTGETAAGPGFERAAERFARGCRDRRLVYVSSAAVFDGNEGRYAETADRSPIDDYGRRLATAEDAVREHCADVAILRTSYLFGFSGGRLDDRLARTRNAVTAGESVAYFEDMYKSPVLVTEAAAAVRALVESEATGVVHAPAPRTSVYEFHRDAMDALGHDASLVERDSIPTEMTVAPDRSLSSDRFASLVGFEPSAVGAGLRSQSAEGSSE